MNRKDIILVAVLINMGLLVILFTSALKPNAHMDEAPAALALNRSDVGEQVAVSKESDSLDQVDKILSQYVEKESSVSQSSTDEIVESAKESTETAFQTLAMPTVDADKYKEVIVMQGDVLEKIARRYQTSVDEIMNINKMNDTRLKIGQILYVPNNPAQKDVSSKKVAKVPMPAVTPLYYTMKKGDNPWSIAIKNHMKVEDLLKLNDLDERKAKRLKPGDKLRIR